jgi:hypothetical protein
MPSLDGRVDNNHRHLWNKNLGNFKALRSSVPVDQCPEDKLKLRLNRRSGNIPRPELSTLGDLACGHEWISQRLVVFVAKRAKRRASNRLQTVIQAPVSRHTQRNDSVFSRFNARTTSH